MIEEAETKFPECEPSSTERGAEENAEDDLPEADQKPSETTSTTSTSKQQKSSTDAFDNQVSEKEKNVELKEQCESDQQDFESNAFEANFDAHFEANFEDAFGSQSVEEAQAQAEQQEEIPKQVVGGRASIPDELAPHQLARLQNLKESNA